MFYLICFDITENRIRSKVVKLLKGHGRRVQKSVFECPNMSEQSFVTMSVTLDEIIDHTTDTIRFYPLCKKCVDGIEFVGVGGEPDLEKFVVV